MGKSVFTPGRDEVGLYTRSCSSEDLYRVVVSGARSERQ